MGKTFIKKLGSLLRIFKAGKKRGFGNEKEDSLNITSESSIRFFEGSSLSGCDSVKRNPILHKSKSSESTATRTVSCVTGEINELKRSHGTYDILSTSKEEEVKCTKSLNRFCQLNHTNNIVLSYHVKLHDSNIWSRAIGRVTQPPISQYNDSSSSSTIQVAEEESSSSGKFPNIRKRHEEAIASIQELNIDNSIHAKLECPNVRKRHPENVPISTQSCREEMSVSSDAQTHEDNEKKYQEPSHVYMGFSESKVQPLVTEAERKIYEGFEEIRPQLESISTQEESECTESSKTVDEQHVKMNLKTIKNEEGFDLLKYDVKSSGDHVVGLSTFPDTLLHSTDVIVDLTSYETEESHEIVNSPRILSSNITEHDELNFGQAELLKEFKTTISKMRNVLNDLEVKKSSHGIVHNLYRDEIKHSSKNVLDSGNISTQTAAMSFNHIVTGTDVGSRNQARNESIKVQLPSNTTTKCRSNFKRIALNTNLKKRRVRRKRGNRCGYNSVTEKAISIVSSSQVGQLRMKMKPEKPRYNKCVVYHITQHKNAIDRCVGPPCPSVREKLVLHNTFSALHFGPIQDFPLLLNKREHENEKKKKTHQEEERVKTVTVLQKDLTETNYHRRKSTSLLSSELPISSNQTSCLKNKTYPNIKCGSSNNDSSLSTSTTTTNWFVLKPSPPLVMKKQESTLDDLLFDVNRASTQEMVSNILEEELKTSGLKGRISSNTMNQIKNQFCDKLNGMKSKNISDVMITVRVPLKNIVSKIKTSKIGRCEDKAISFSNTTDSNIESPSSSSYNKGTQVSGSRSYANDNLQTIPEKMSRKSTEIYQHNKLLRENMSSRRFSTFKKIFGHKATSSSSINPFGYLVPRTSRIYFSDHSTSSPKFSVNPVIRETVRYAHKKTSTTPKRSSVSLYREDKHIRRNKKEGFFLNLPPNRYKKNRDQISKLFDESDSSEWRYFGESKLIYHVQDSSFYSTSRTDDRLSSELSYFPVQQVSSRPDVRVKSKYISFCDLPKRFDSEVQTPKIFLESPTKDNGHLIVPPRPNLRNADVNTSKVKFFENNETQCETEANVSPQTCENESRNKTKRIKGTDNAFENSFDEFSVVSLPKVHFKDDIDGEKCETLVNNSTQNDSFALHGNRGSSMNNKKDELIGVPPRKSKSIRSLWAENNENTEYNTTNIVAEEIEAMKINNDDRLKNLKEQQRKNPAQNKSSMILQTSSDSNFIHMDQKQSGVQPVNVATTAALEKEPEDIVTMESTQVDSIISLSKKEQGPIEVAASNESSTESRMTVLMRDVVNLCNSSFVKSRDCIVELTLYNLIKQIILEHCSHLSAQSRQKIESILANFIKLSKQKVGNQDADIVESAIENLVREVCCRDAFVKNHEEKHGDELHMYEESDQDVRRVHTRNQKSKHSRSRSNQRRHKHDLKNRSHQREAEEELRGKYHHREEQKKYKTKRRHKHNCDADEKFDRGRKEHESKYRSVDGKREYLALVHRLKELEEVTKQLSNVAENQQNPQFDEDAYYRKHENWFTGYLFANPKYSSMKKMPFRLNQLVRNGKEYQKKPINVNYFQTELEQKVSPISRELPNLPDKKIVVNLSNLKLLAENCVGLKSTSIKESTPITDTIEGNQILINKILSSEMKNECRNRIRHTFKHQEKNSRHYVKDIRSESLNRDKESFTITIHGKNKSKRKNFKDNRVKSSKKMKNYMRIKMVRKKKIVASKSDQKSSDIVCSRRINMDFAALTDIHKITKKYIKGEYHELNCD